MMATQHDSKMTILKTKLQIPDNHPLFISRPHLLSKMDNILEYKITMITSPAGTGKTSLLCDWLRCCGVPFSWLSIDSRDNDPAIFWSYIVSALSKNIHSKGRKTCELIHSPLKPPWETIVTHLINEIIEKKEPMILVLDNCHHIDNKEIYDSLFFFLVNLPPNMHVCLATRSSLKLPVARFRSTEQLYEIGYPDIRFTENETYSLICKTIDSTISEADVRHIFRFTDGWVTGIHLFSLILKEQGESTGKIDISTFCSGNHYYFVDYFLEEVYNHFSNSKQLFLLQTSILNRFNQSLIRFMTNENENDDLFIELSKSNVFIVPFDGERRWFRYNRPFRDFLRRRLELEYPKTIPLLHTLASRWYDDNNLMEESHYHRLKGYKYGEKAERNGLRSLLSVPLTKRELEIIKLVANGLSNKEISQKLYISNGTVKIHLNRIYSKLNATNRIQAVAKAKKLRLL